MRIIKASDVTEAIKKMAMDSCHYLNSEVTQAIRKAKNDETSPLGKIILQELLDNANIARNELIPYCQDTGLAVVFVEMGQEVEIQGGLLSHAIDEGVRQGYDEGYLRKSVCDPLTRKNTGDNTPAIIHLSLVEGDKLKLMLAAKGGGSENMSSVVMLKPADGIEGIKKYVIRKCFEAGGNPCPPIIIGVGIGGNLEYAALLAKKALLLPLAHRNPDPVLARMEEEILEEVNKSGHGPMGLGGRNFALAVKIMKAPCHIASLPLALNIDCHAHRHKEMIL
ncbi:fumarate hydratase [Candidatus Sumerlaeota bacterium]|nr:fumarate hydratase [Candidatus Sumerlaeota bacterium]